MGDFDVLKNMIENEIRFAKPRDADFEHYWRQLFLVPRELANVAAQHGIVTQANKLPGEKTRGKLVQLCVDAISNIPKRERPTSAAYKRAVDLQNFLRNKPIAIFILGVVAGLGVACSSNFNSNQA